MNRNDPAPAVRAGLGETPPDPRPGDEDAARLYEASAGFLADALMDAMSALDDDDELSPALVDALTVEYRKRPAYADECADIVAGHGLGMYWEGER